MDGWMEDVKCGEGLYCLNTEGSYQCVCRPGLAGPDCGQTGGAD